MTYGQGTPAWPGGHSARLSQQVESLRPGVRTEVALDYGVRALSASRLCRRTPRRPVEAIVEQAARWAARANSWLALGGEHTVTAGLVRGPCGPWEGPLTVVQIDAHAGPAGRVQREPLANCHACTARRLLDEPEAEQGPAGGRPFGLPEEVNFAARHPERVRHLVC